MTVAVIVAATMARDRPARPARAGQRDGASDRNGPGERPGGTAAVQPSAVQPSAVLPCPSLRSGQAMTEPLLGRLCGQLATLGVLDLVVIAPPGAGGRLRDIAWEAISRAGMTVAAATGDLREAPGGAGTEAGTQAGPGAGTEGGPGAGGGEPAPRRRPARPGGTASIDLIECADVAAQLRVVAQVAAEQGGRDEPLLVCAGDVVAHTGALALTAAARGTAALAEAPDAPAAALFAAGRDLRPALRTSGQAAGRTVAAAGSSYHRVTAPDAVGCGVFLVSPADRQPLAAAAEQLAALAEKAGAGETTLDAGAATARPAGGRRPPRQPGAFGDTVALLLVGLVRGGVTVQVLTAHPLRCVRVATGQQARAAAGELHTVPEGRLRMDAAVKAADGFVATFLVSPYSRYIARWAAGRQVSPHTVTAASAGLALLAAVWFSAGTRAGLIAGAVLLFCAFALDCVDGQLARYARCSSLAGSWLDPVSDRVKEYLVYAGLAAGGAAADQAGVWGLALAAMAVQAIRHIIGLSYRLGSTAVRPPDPRHSRPLPLDEPADYAVAPPAATGAPGPVTAGPLRAAQQRVRRAAAGIARGLRWAARIGYLPIGERFLVIGVTAAVAGARTTFLVLLGWGGAAGIITVAALIVRSVAGSRGPAGGAGGAPADDARRRPRRAARVPAAPRAVAGCRDDGVIAQALGRLVGGQLPPLLPAIAGVTVTAALAGAGLHYGEIMAIAPVAAMLLAGLGCAHPHDGRVDWLVPPLLRAGEYLYLGAVGVAGGVPAPLIFALVAAVAVHHYDIAGRALLSSAVVPPPWAVAAGLGWDGRMLVIALAAMAGIAPFAFAVASAYLWIFFIWESLTGWLTAPRDHLLAEAPGPDLEDGGGW